MLLPGLKCSLCYGGEKQQLSPSVSQPVTGTWLRKRLMGRKIPVQKECAKGFAAGMERGISSEDKQAIWLLRARLCCRKEGVVDKYYLRGTWYR